jgi:HD-GYP domain-containing protein (c-di-GMP phosphodiesterase class II)/DNA-binding CsgD family transcriptional regulator
MAEIIGRLSLAFDIASDFPQGKAVRSAVLAVELGALADASEEELRDTFWLSLFAYLGCTGLAFEASLVGAGDNRAAAGVSPDAMGETAARLARMAGAGPSILAALGQTDERWDGGRLPARLEGEALALATRLHQFGHVVEIAHGRLGRAGAAALVRRRAGGQLDPRLAKLFLDHQAALFASIEDPKIFDRFLSLEPRPVTLADERQMDDVVSALAMFTDLKCPIFVGHSTGVAALAERAARQMDMNAEETRALRWAALLHDVGRLSVPNSIWTRPGPLDWSQWERVRLHAYYTERVLSPIPALDDAKEIAAAAHERIDGSGYYRHREGRALLAPARLLAAADTAFAMSEERPHRSALDAAAIARTLVSEVCEGRLDATAVDAVLASLGLDERATPPSVGGLSVREVDVSRLLARGKTNQEIADLLGISVRTVHNHVAHIFDKLGVHSRSGAAIWLMEHDFAN